MGSPRIPVAQADASCATQNATRSLRAAPIERTRNVPPLRSAPTGPQPGGDGLRLFFARRIRLNQWANEDVQGAARPLFVGASEMTRTTKMPMVTYYSRISRSRACTGAESKPRHEPPARRTSNRASARRASNRASARRTSNRASARRASNGANPRPIPNVRRGTIAQRMPSPRCSAAGTLRQRCVARRRPRRGALRLG